MTEERPRTTATARDPVTIECGPALLEIYAPAADVRGRVLQVPGLSGPSGIGYRPLYVQLCQTLALDGYEAAFFAGRGHRGRPGEFSFPGLLEDLGAVVDAWIGTGETVHLMAKSSGCPVALRFAATVPDLVKSVLLWGASPERVYRDLFPATGETSYTKGLRERGTRLAAEFRGTLFFPEHEIDSVDCPVWVGLGTQDQFSSPSEQLRIFEPGLKCETLFIIGDCPHSVAKGTSAWTPFYGMIRAWLESSA